MIKFNLYNVTDGVNKVWVWYSINGRSDNRKCVTISHKDWNDNLLKVFPKNYKNESDCHVTSCGDVTLFEDNPLYPRALKTALISHGRREKMKKMNSKEMTYEQTVIYFKNALYEEMDKQDTYDVRDVANTVAIVCDENGVNPCSIENEKCWWEAISCFSTEQKRGLTT